MVTCFSRQTILVELANLDVKFHLLLLHPAGTTSISAYWRVKSLGKHQNILINAILSKVSDMFLQWWSMRKSDFTEVRTCMVKLIESIINKNAFR